MWLKIAIYNYSRITSALPRISCNFFSVNSDLFLLTKVMKSEKMRSSASDVTKFLLLVINLALLLHEKFLILKKQYNAMQKQFTATLNTTHPTPERVFWGGAVSRPDECTRPCTEQTRPAAHQRWRPKGLY